MFCSQIETAFTKQNDLNNSFHQRTGQLEITTHSIDGKVDRLLTLMEPTNTQSRKTPQTTENMACEDDEPPNHHHSIPTAGKIST
jgi:hypothetical protein